MCELQQTRAKLALPFVPLDSRWRGVGVAGCDGRGLPVQRPIPSSSLV